MRINKIIYRTFAILALLNLLAFTNVNAQERRAKSDDKFSDKLFFGGSLGLTIGDITQVDVLPVAGIWVIPQWSLGVGGRYSYYSQRSLALGDFGQRYRSHIWGVSAFTQILPVADFSEVLPVSTRGGLMFHGEYEMLYIDRQRIDPTQNKKTWVDILLVGVGYRQLVGEKAALNIMLLWHFTQDDFTPYPQNPIIRVNFTI
ncbi:MAG: hypothetical protein ACLFNU_05340 [Bacteroidales bacterium]